MRGDYESMNGRRALQAKRGQGWNLGGRAAGGKLGFLLYLLLFGGKTSDKEASWNLMSD